MKRLRGALASPVPAFALAVLLAVVPAVVLAGGAGPAAGQQPPDSPPPPAEGQTSSTPPAGGPPPTVATTDASNHAAARGLVAVADELAALAALGALAAPPPDGLDALLAALAREVPGAPDDPAAVGDAFVAADDAGAAALSALTGAGIQPSREVRRTLSPTTGAERDAVLAGTPTFDALDYVRALVHLDASDGQPPSTNELAALAALAEPLAAAVAEAERLLADQPEPPPTPATTPDTTSAPGATGDGEPVDATNDAAGDDGPSLWVVIVAVAAVATAVVAGLAVYGQRARRNRPADDELDELGRQLAAATEASLADPLTGVGNRRRLEADLAQVLSPPPPPTHTSVVMVDLDHFKSVNDRRGHAVGDRLLRGAAERLEREVGSLGSVYRYGGEEFCVVLPGAPPEVAAALAERLRAALAAEPFDPGDGGAPLEVTASFGVATASAGDDAHGEGLDAHVLVARADKALYAAKEQGRNRVVQA